MDTTKQNPGGMSELHLAAAHADIDKVKALLATHTGPLPTNNKNETPLFSCLKCRISDTPEDKATRAQIFELLWDQTPEQLMHQDREGYTVLQLMAVGNFANLIQTCLTAAPTLGHIPANFQNGTFPIHNAILNGAYDAAKALFETDSNTSSYVDDEDQTPLHYAVRYSNLDMVKLCCEHQKDNLNAQDREEKTALNWATDEDIIRYLVDAGAEKNDEADRNSTVYR